MAHGDRPTQMRGRAGTAAWPLPHITLQSAHPQSRLSICPALSHHHLNPFDCKMRADHCRSAQSDLKSVKRRSRNWPRAISQSGWCGCRSVSGKNQRSLGLKTAGKTVLVHYCGPHWHRHLVGRQPCLSSSADMRSDASPCSEGLVPAPEPPSALLSSSPLLSSGMLILARGALMGGTWPSRDGRLLLRLPVLLAAVSAALRVPLRLHSSRAGRASCSVGVSLHCLTHRACC